MTRAALSLNVAEDVSTNSLRPYMGHMIRPIKYLVSVLVYCTTAVYTNTAISLETLIPQILEVLPC